MSSKSSQHTPRKPRHVRTKTGCYSCRARRKKCDERKPTCNACERNVLICSWPDEANDNRSQASKQSRKAPPSSHFTAGSPASSSSEVYDADNNSESLLEEIPASNSRTDPVVILGNHDPGAVKLMCTYQPLFGQPQPSIYGALRYPTSRILFEYYINKTAGHVSAHPRDFNPFIQQLMPWAISNELILQSLLAWSGSHLSLILSEVKETTCTHYAQAIRGVKYGLTKYSTGAEDVVLPLLISTLMLCFIEVSHLSTTNLVH